MLGLVQVQGDLVDPVGRNRQIILRAVVGEKGVVYVDEIAPIVDAEVYIP
jgi:hypothetical protein